MTSLRHSIVEHAPFVGIVVGQLADVVQKINLPIVLLLTVALSWGAWVTMMVTNTSAQAERNREIIARNENIGQELTERVRTHETNGASVHLAVTQQLTALAGQGDHLADRLDELRTEIAGWRKDWRENWRGQSGGSSSAEPGR